MNVIIIEDEKLSSDHLKTLIKKVDAAITITHQFDSVKASIENIEKLESADLIFIDIHLADGLSFEIINKLKVAVPLIFTTAYDEYAIKAFKFNSIDYLLKPIGLSDLKLAIEKFKNITKERKPIEINQYLEKYQQLPQSFKTRFLVKSIDGIISIKIEEISHFVFEDGCVLLVTNQNKKHIIDYSLDDVIQLIEPKQFFRINRKVIIHINSIQKISNYFNSRLKVVVSHLEDDDCIVSRERVADFKAWLDA
jgi:DNA-binding LytR/AlgR family response regulator